MKTKSDIVIGAYLEKVKNVPLSGLPLFTTLDCRILMEQYAKQEAIAFEEWVSENGWIKDPLPTTEFDDDICRYTNIAVIDISSDEKLKILTVEQLYELFKNS